MSNYRRHRRNCRRKQRHASEEEAQKHSDWRYHNQPWMLKRTIGYRPYKCQWCDGWHVGRYKKFKR